MASRILASWNPDARGGCSPRNRPSIVERGGCTVNRGMSITFPNESPAYRSAREALLQREVELRRQMERVAVELRALPPGGNVPEDYLFDCIRERGVLGTVRMSELF